MNLLAQNTAPEGMFLTGIRRQQSFISDEIAIISIYHSLYENNSIPWSSIAFIYPFHYWPQHCFIIFVPKYKQMKGKINYNGENFNSCYFRDRTKHSLSHVT